MHNYFVGKSFLVLERT